MENQNVIAKETLSEFWANLGGKKNNGNGFSRKEKLSELIRVANTVLIVYRNGQSNVYVRERFNKVKFQRHSLHSHKKCFVCPNDATERHHIIPIKNGGKNSKKNLVSLCENCHAEVHPWLK